MKKTKHLLLAAMIIPTLSNGAMAKTANFVCDTVKTIDFKGKKQQFKDKFTYTVETQKKKVTDNYGFVYDLKELSPKRLYFVTPPDKTKWFTAIDINRENGAYVINAYNPMGKKAPSTITYSGICKTAK